MAVNGKPPRTTAADEEAPPRIRDLAEACVRFVHGAVGVQLDYTAETLPLLDHYLEDARKAAAARPETAPLVAHAAGAYFGEVVRRRHRSWWRADGDDPAFYRIELSEVYLAFSPVALIADALVRTSEEEGGDMAHFELEEGDRAAVAERLADLPEVPVDEYYAPSTRLEVIDIVVDAIRSRKLAEGDDTDMALEPEDYEN